MITIGSSKGPRADDTGAGGGYQTSKPAGLGPSVDNGRDGPYNRIQSPPASNPAHDPGTSVYGGETYHGAEKPGLGPTPISGKDGPFHPINSSSTNPGQDVAASGSGEYNPTHFNIKDGTWNDAGKLAPSDGGISQTEGYKVLGRVDVTDRPIPNADPGGEGNWSFEQTNYFRNPDYDSDEY